MNSYLKKIIQYAAGKAANSILLLLLLPIFSRFLVPEEYAVYTNVMLFFSLAALVYLLGIQQAMYSYYHDKNGEKYKATLISSTYITILCSGAIFSTLIIIFKDQLALLIVRDIQYSHIFVWISIILFFNNFTALTLSVLNIMEDAGRFAVLGLIQNVSNFLILLAGGIFNNFTIDFVFLSLMVSTLISSIIALVMIGKVYRSNKSGGEELYSKELIIPIIRFGLVMIPGTLAVIAMRAADRFMLAHFSSGGMYDVGIYAIGYKIGSIMIFLVTMMNTVFLPYAMRISKHNKAGEIYRKIFNYYVWGGAFLGMAIIMFSPEIFSIFIDENYHLAASLTYIGVISTYLQGVFNLVNVSFYANKNAGAISLAVILGAVINIVLNYFLIPKYGIAGAGAASIIAYLLIVLMNYIYGEYKYQPRFGMAAMLITLPSLGGIAWLTAKDEMSIIHSLLKILLSLVIILVIYLNLKRKNELQSFKDIVKKD